MGSYQSKPTKIKTIHEGEDGEFLKWISGAMQGWRTSMEDADVAAIDFFKPGTALFGVFDGHGGSEVSYFIKKYFPTVLKHFISQETPTDYGAALTKSFLFLDEKMMSRTGLEELETLLIKEHAHSAYDDSDGTPAPSAAERVQALPQIVSAGSTAVVLLIVDNVMYVANAGDSRCVVSRKGVAVPLTFDHKPDDQIELDRIHKAGGFVTAGRVGGTLNLSRAFGDYEFKQNTSIPAESQMVTPNPDIRVESVQDDADEFIILACDGIFEKLTWDTVVDFVRERLKKGYELKKIIEEILEECCATLHGGQGSDNMTIQIILPPTTASKELIALGEEYKKNFPPDTLGTADDILVETITENPQPTQPTSDSSTTQDDHEHTEDSSNVPSSSEGAQPTSDDSLGNSPTRTADDNTSFA